MPGLYLLALLVSAAGIATIDIRHRLVFAVRSRRHRLAALGAVVAGVVMMLAWDAVGIITDVFAKGSSTLFIGVDLAPELPLEEPVFLAFLTYLSLVLHAGWMRLRERRTP